MKITIRPDPDCIEFIRSVLKERTIDFLKSVGVPANDAWNWEATHIVEINESDPPLVDVFDMKCYLPNELFTETEWIFKVSRKKFLTPFIISGIAVCCCLLHTDGLKPLPENLLNLNCYGYGGETLNEYLQELKNLPFLKSISINNEKLKDISFLKNLVNLQTINLSGCELLTDISSLAGLLNLQSLNLEGCELLTGISSLAGLLNLLSLNLKGCKSITNISSIKTLINLVTLNLSFCNSLTDISGLSGLLNLQTLKLVGCNSLTDISGLSGLLNLQTLDLELMELTDISGLSGLLHLKTLLNLDLMKLTNISSLSGLLNLQTLKLVGCNSLTDISGLSGLLNLKTMNLVGCNSLTDGCTPLTDISSLSGLLNLQTLNLELMELTDISGLSGLLNLKTLNFGSCFSLTDISSLSGLLNLQTLNLKHCNSLTNINSLSGLLKLQTLDLGGCESITDISSLAKLVNLRITNLSYCKSLTDIKSLSGLLNMQTLKLQNCESLTDIRSLAGLVNLQSLNFEGCKRIQNYSSLRNCLALKYLTESIMHPAESAELLCFLAVQRKDISFISEKAGSWLNELEMGFDQKHSSTNDLACSLAQALILANLEEIGLSFHQTLLNHPNVGLAPWKIWFSENLKTFGWDVFYHGAELNKPRELTFGAIGGISFCLPSLENDPAQIAWARKWISEIHSLHNNNPNFLKPAAAEWCLALKRLGEDDLLREWIEKFTDPSDPSALDPIHKVFSAYALDLNDSEFALEYALKINDPKLRDESILYLAQQFIKEGETTQAGEFLFLLTQVESRTQLAYSLAENAAYLKIDENAHRLLAACGDNPQSLASILDKLRLANPNSKILKIMHEKLGDEIELEIPASFITTERNNLTNILFKIKDSRQLIKIRQAIESIMKSS